jgi:hypothetical protein
MIEVGPRLILIKFRALWPLRALVIAHIGLRTLRNHEGRRALLA